MGLFGKDPDPKEKVREWNRKLRQEQRQLDRQINGIKREEAKAVQQVKAAAKKNDMDVCKILAKEVVQSRKAVGKIHTTKAQINSVMMAMDQQLAAMRMAGSIQRSSEVLKSMNSLVRVPEVASTMRELSREMMKMGIIDEMMEETMEMMDPEDMEEEVQNEVDKVLDEILKGKMEQAPAVPAGSISVAGTSEEVPVEPESLNEMKERLAALKEV